MPELLTTHQQQLEDKARHHTVNIGHGMSSMPTTGYDTPEVEPIIQESIFHPVRAFEDLIKSIEGLTEKVDLLLKQQLKERTFVDTPFAVGDTVGYTVDYHERKYVYVYTFADVTLNLSSGGSKAITGNTWTNLSPMRGTIVTAQGGSNSTPTGMIFRACDVVMN